MKESFKRFATSQEKDTTTTQSDETQQEFKTHTVYSLHTSLLYSYSDCHYLSDVTFYSLQLLLSRIFLLK